MKAPFSTPLREISVRMPLREFWISISDAYFFAKETKADFFNTIGRSLPVVTIECAGQVECKRLVSTNAIDWSVAMQMGGQFHAITQHALHTVHFHARHVDRKSVV